MHRHLSTLQRCSGSLALVVALAMTITAVVDNHPPSASADSAPVTVITSAPVNSTSGSDFTVSVLGDGTTTVDNPGGTAPVTQLCLPPSVTTAQDFCLGTSDQADPPITISGYASQAQGLPNGAMDWLVDEAVTKVAILHGVAADDMVRTYARPEIRVEVASEILNILNKKLYGQTLSPEETQVYDTLNAVYKEQQVTAATQALDEYKLWSADPCAYVAPAPPAGSGLPVVANDARTSTACNQPNSPAQLFKFTNDTPPASTFDTWASYRHPTPSMVHASDADFKQMTVGTTSGVVTAVGTGVALASATAGGFAEAAHVASLAADIASESEVFSETAVSAGEALADMGVTVGGAAAAAAGAVAFIVLGVVIGAVSIYQLVEDGQPGQELTERAEDAAAQTDPLGIESRMADYAGLDMSTLQDPVGEPKAAIHDDTFFQQLLAQSDEWQMFTDGGNLIPDPTTGYTAASTPDDDQFLVNGTAQPFIQLMAPAGAVGRAGTPIDGYRVRFSRGWLMVSEGVSSGSTVTWGPYSPRLSVDYLDPDGNKGQMSLIQHGPDGQPPTLDFQLTKPQADGTIAASFSPTWSFKPNAATTETVTLQTSQPVLPQINVVPSVEGTMVADNIITLKSNASTPAEDTNGQFTWTLERLNSDGSVAQTIAPPSGNVVNFQQRFDTPGRYRAIVTFAGTSPTTFSTSGRVEFTIGTPTPQIQTAQVVDDRVLNGALFLNLRLLQDTRGDTYTVKVDWATDGSGTTDSDTYTVNCEDTGFDTCDTGPLISPDDAPTNANWSTSPTFVIPAGENYLPYVNVTITNTYGQVIKEAFPITPGDQRPQYATSIPAVSFPAGETSDYTVNVVQLTPATLPTGISQELTIQPYIDQITDQLPPGMRPDIAQIDGNWWLQLKGTPSAESMGTHVFYFPFEQEPIGSGLRPPPALVSLNVVAAVAPGYRAILRGVPAEFLDRRYRNTYPDYTVQVAQVLAAGQTSFSPYTGMVMCKLVSAGQTVFDKPCAQNKPFPWPTERITDTGEMQASVYLESTSQPISADGPYTATLSTQFLNIDVSSTTPAASALKQSFGLKLDDNGFILAPFTGYTVSCSLDKAAYKPCFGNGSLTLNRVPGTHTIDVKAIKAAPNAATTTIRYTWVVKAPKKTLGLKLPVRSIKRGRSMVVKGSLLLPSESYVVKIGGRKVASGKATSAGTISRSIKIPIGLSPGRYKVVLIGTNAARTTFRWVRVRR